MTILKVFCSIPSPVGLTLLIKFESVTYYILVLPCFESPFDDVSFLWWKVPVAWPGICFGSTPLRPEGPKFEAEGREWN